MVAKVQPAQNPRDNPSYATWKRIDGIVVLDVFCGSSFVGHSTIKLGLATGLPGEQIEVEDARDLLGFGDRIAVGLDRGNRVPDWQFCGYVVTNQLSIASNAERCIWKAVGPEWWWGDSSPQNGAGMVVRGQMRRKSYADDAWRTAPATVTPYIDWDLFTDERAVFNPDGKRNMTRDDVVLSPNGRKPIVKGRLWESPDRRISSIDVAFPWDMRQAAKMIVEQFGDLEFAGIASPDWSNVPMSAGDILRETDVEGYGCYEALRRTLGNKFGFMVDPRPARPDGTPVDVTGKSWGPFQISFFRRTDGESANFYLNPKGTPMREAQASITRLEVASDTSKTANFVRVQGTYVRSVKLVYWGQRTPGLPANLKRTSIQHGWSNGEANLGDFQNPNDHTIEATFTGVTAAKRDEWLKRYHTKGSLHAQYWRIFRWFTWNEANELDTTQQAKYGATLANWYAPDLQGIADSPDKPAVWYRRRRKMLDTLYLRNAALSQWERHRPTLFLTAAPTATGTEWDTLKWRRISDTHYNIDAERCAIQFTADDLAEWRPLDKQDSVETDDTQSWPDDPRTFATLLLSGQLRFCIECSVPIDDAMIAEALPEDSGLPMPRQVWIPAQKNFIKTVSYADGLSAPSGLAVANLDMLADAQQQADLTRDSAQDTAVHASISTAGDWERQKIGSQITSIDGRAIDLGKGAQIVAVRLDTRSYNYEYLTESLALALKDRDRKLLDRKAQVYRNAKRVTRFTDESKQ
jgi:hypothetical protein